MDQSYISLSEAAKLTDYSQEYISLLCRQKKLKGIKMGRNWVTTKEWLQEYISKTKEKGNVVNKIQKFKKIKSKKLQVKKKNKRELLTNYDSLAAFESQNKFSLLVNFMMIIFFVFVFGINFLFFQGWSSSLDKKLAKLKINQNHRIMLSTNESLLVEKEHQGRVAGTKDENEDYQAEKKIEIEKNNLYIAH